MAVIINNTSFFSEVVIFGSLGLIQNVLKKYLLLVLLSFPVYNYSHINSISFLLGENSTISAEGYVSKVSLIQNDFINNIELHFNC